MKRVFKCLALMLLGFGVATSQIPCTLSYQGVLTDSSGTTPRPDGSYQFTFKLYDSTAVVWQETKILQTKNGLFSTALGDATPFGGVTFEKPYTLGIQVGAEPELSPRIPLTSVGYSMNALRADTAKVAVADGIWSRGSGSNIYRQDGNVGIGTTAPTAQLDIQGRPRWTTAQWYKGLKLNNGHAIQFDAGSGLKFGMGASSSGTSLYFFTVTSDGTSEDPLYKMRLDESGRLHVGNTHIYR